MEFFVLSGCAIQGINECHYADWRTIGYEDGAHGINASRINKHRNACAKHGIAPDLRSMNKVGSRASEVLYTSEGVRFRCFRLSILLCLPR